ncbi:hypothetical protein SCNU_10621 [Gordonia neofelifaecis NRRL B-59395]|uniref:SnoaL-like domain-containing protein n=2 Tax=Gordonia TaxID=2053 RepID=F1YJP6_9ACTN|nr:hypothetical protein SCNU_10621 [Gordonia neofelifaecis NRRL B-59395]
MLATVEGSPAAVAAHDKEQWLSLFADGAVVNDPVGSSPHRGDEQLSRFYDTFIAPNTIVFHQEHDDVVSGSTVVRDVTLEIRMSDDVVLHVPTHLRYEMTSPDRIAGLYAHWELPTMVMQLLKKGVHALPVSARLSGSMVRNQGLAGAFGFGRGFLRAGENQKRTAIAFLAAPTAQLPAKDGTGASLTPADLSGWRAGKCLAAGRFVTVSLQRDDDHGVAMFEFAKRDLVAVTLYVER